MSMTKIDFELASAAGLSVCAGVDSTFSRQVSRLIAAVRAPLLAELAKNKAPACPDGMIEHHAKIDGVELVFHFEYFPAQSPCGLLEYRGYPTINPVAWFHKGDNITDIFDIDAKNNARICNEALAAYEDSK